MMAMIVTRDQSYDWLLKYLISDLVKRGTKTLTDDLDSSVLKSLFLPIGRPGKCADGCRARTHGFDIVTDASEEIMEALLAAVEAEG